MLSFFEGGVDVELGGGGGVDLLSGAAVVVLELGGAVGLLWMTYVVFVVGAAVLDSSFLGDEDDGASLGNWRGAWEREL